MNLYYFILIGLLFSVSLELPAGVNAFRLFVFAYIFQEKGHDNICM
jgi:hypothetical protein